jgi:hypothetical protein
VIGLTLIAIELEPEYRSVTRSLSGWSSKGDPNASITAESEVTNFFRLLKLIRRSDSPMIAIRVELKYRAIVIFLSKWGPNGEHNDPIIAESEVIDSLKLLKLI